MTDEPYLKALIADSRELQREYQSAPKREEWTDAQVRDVVRGNAESDRLAAMGYVATMHASPTPPMQSEIERLSKLT